MEKYNVEQDPMYIHFINSKPTITQPTIIQYKTVLQKFAEATQQTITQIIENCINQQNKVTEKTTNKTTDTEGNTIIEKTITRFDVNNPNSNINKYLNLHINYCKKRNNTNYTINHDLGTIYTFLRYYNVELPHREKYGRETAEWHLLTKEDFNFIINDSTISHKSLIKHLISSGMRLTDALNLTIGEYMKATQDYHNYVDVDEFIDNAPQNMIATWDFYPKKTEKFKVRCVTFSDPETNNLILQNLRKIKNESLPRINRKLGKNLTLSKNDALFASTRKMYKGHLSQHSISDVFYKKNRKLREHHINLIKERIENKELSIEDEAEEISKIPKFHAHGCRKYFISTINKNCGDLRLCTLMEGHISPVYTDPSYVKYDIEDVKEAYMAAIPDLSLENTETKVYTSEIRREMESKINSLEKELESKTTEADLMNTRLDSIEELLSNMGIGNIVEKVKK